MLLYSKNYTHVNSLQKEGKKALFLFAKKAKKLIIKLIQFYINSLN